MKTPKFVHTVKAVVIVGTAEVKSQVERHQNVRAGKKVVKAEIAAMGAQLREQQEFYDALAKEQTQFVKHQKEEARRIAKEQAKVEAEAARVAAEIEQAKNDLLAAEARLAELAVKEVNSK